MSQLAWSNRVARFCRLYGIKRRNLPKFLSTEAYRQAKAQAEAGANGRVVHMMLCEAMEQAGLDHGRAKAPPRRR